MPLSPCTLTFFMFLQCAEPYVPQDLCKDRLVFPDLCLAASDMAPGSELLQHPPREAFPDGSVLKVSLPPVHTIVSPKLRLLTDGSSVLIHRVSGKQSSGCSSSEEPANHARPCPPGVRD